MFQRIVITDAEVAEAMKDKEFVKKAVRSQLRRERGARAFIAERQEKERQVHGG